MSEEYTGGSVSYYRVNVLNPTSEDVPPYQAECNDIIEALGMNYAEGNAFKALWRRAAARNLGMAKKGYEDGLYDAEKVVFFGQRLVAQESALKAEALSEQRNVFSEIMEGIQEMKECRENNGGKPEWKDAPSWAKWMCGDSEGWAWCEKEPQLESDDDEPDSSMKDWCAKSVGRYEFASYGSAGYRYKEPRP